MNRKPPVIARVTPEQFEAMHVRRGGRAAQATAFVAPADEATRDGWDRDVSTREKVADALALRDAPPVVVGAVDAQTLEAIRRRHRDRWEASARQYARRLGVEDVEALPSTARHGRICRPRQHRRRQTYDSADDDAIALLGAVIDAGGGELLDVERAAAVVYRDWDHLRFARALNAAIALGLLAVDADTAGDVWILARWESE